MSEKNHIEQRSRSAIRLAIVVLICLLLTYCAQRLYSSLRNEASTQSSVNQEHSALPAPVKTETPLIAAKQVTAPPRNTGDTLPAILDKDLHPQDKRPVSSNNPVQTEPPIPQGQGAQSRDLAQPREASASNTEVISKTEKIVPASPPGAAQEPVAGAAALTPDVHQDRSQDKDVEILGETFTEPISGMEFILVRGGCYQMGSDLTAFEGPVHEVCVDDFYLAKYEVTQRQWTKIMGRHFSYFKGNLRPVERVTWDDTQRFIAQLNNKSGLGYRLPTEAEWEYAARSGGEDRLYAGASDEESLARFAWHVANSNRQTHMVGMKKPNSLGLHDMSGNVWEWCSDWYDESYYANSPRNNPQGPDTGRYRVIRGGEWELSAGFTRTTYREAAKPNIRRSDIGFRLALSLPDLTEP